MLTNSYRYWDNIRRYSFLFDSSVSKRHILLKFLYFGWDYNGYASQVCTTETVEEHLMSALTRCCLIEKRETSNYHRCGRTDAGVTAFSQVISIGRFGAPSFYYHINYMGIRYPSIRSMG